MNQILKNAHKQKHFSNLNFNNMISTNASSNDSEKKHNFNIIKTRNVIDALLSQCGEKWKFWLKKTQQVHLLTVSNFDVV